MIEKFKGLCKKYREIIIYLFFGGLSTIVSWGSYFLLTKPFYVNYQIAQWISWIATVIFAFIVNKFFVFGNRDITKDGLIKQIWQFLYIRIVSGILEYLLLLLMVEQLKISDDISKIIVSVITVILNYIASKFYIFKKKSIPSGEYGTDSQKKDD